MKTKTVTNYRRPVCVSKSKVYPCVPAINECDNDPMDLQLNADYRNTPIYYRVEVQVKVWFFWITVWAKTCNIDDTDTCTYLDNRAAEVAKCLEAEI